MLIPTRFVHERPPRTGRPTSQAPPTFRTARHHRLRSSTKAAASTTPHLPPLISGILLVATNPIYPYFHAPIPHIQICLSSSAAAPSSRPSRRSQPQRPRSTWSLTCTAGTFSIPQCTQYSFQLHTFPFLAVDRTAQSLPPRPCARSGLSPCNPSTNVL